MRIEKYNWKLEDCKFFDQIILSKDWILVIDWQKLNWRIQYAKTWKLYWEFIYEIHWNKYRIYLYNFWFMKIILQSKK